LLLKWLKNWAFLDTIIELKLLCFIIVLKVLYLYNRYHFISFPFANIESVQNYISIFNNILFSLLSILSFSLHSIFTTILNKISILHYFCTDETFLKVSMNSTSGLWGFRVFSNGPGSHFIVSSSKKVY